MLAAYITVNKYTHYTHYFCLCFWYWKVDEINITFWLTVLSWTLTAKLEHCAHHVDGFWIHILTDLPRYDFDKCEGFGKWSVDLVLPLIRRVIKTCVSSVYWQTVLFCRSSLLRRRCYVKKGSLRMPERSWQWSDSSSTSSFPPSCGRTVRNSESLCDPTHPQCNSDPWNAQDHLPATFRGRRLHASVEM